MFDEAVHAGHSQITVKLALLVGFATCLLTTPLCGQAPEFRRGTWDFGIWAAAATGEENTNSFSEAQVFSAGVFAGKVLTNEIGTGWRRGRLEYGFDLAPLFVQFRPQRVFGLAFDPVILRWNSSLHRGRVSPYIELGGGGVHTNSNFPAGDTSNFNFIARGGGGILIAAKRTQAFEIGCHWWHISNANLGTRNPEFNGIQVS
jgi:lipid A 3-O-deacylase